MRSRTSFVCFGVAHATLALVTLAMACGKTSSSGGSHATAGNSGSGSGGPGSTSSGNGGSGNGSGGSGSGSSANGSCGNGGAGAGGGGASGSGSGGGSAGAGGSGSGGGGAGAGGSGNGSSSSSGGSSSNGPIIQSLSANPTSVTPMGTTLTAIVADGVSPVVGGTLTDKASGTTYGQAKAIEFAAGGSDPRVVTARFFDNNGHTASQDLTLTLECGVSSESPCSDTCRDFMTDSANCGACGTTCTNSVVCQQGGSACACRRGHCSDTVNSEMGEGASCDAVCQKLSAHCVPNTCAGFPTCAQDRDGNNVARCDSSSPFHTCCCQ